MTSGPITWIWIWLPAIYVAGHVARAMFWFDGGLLQFWHQTGVWSRWSKILFIISIVTAFASGNDQLKTVSLLVSMGAFFGHLVAMSMLSRPTGS